MNVTILAIIHVSLLLALYTLCSVFVLSCIFKRAPVFVESQPGIGDTRFHREWRPAEERGEWGRGDRWRAQGEPGEWWFSRAAPSVTREEGPFLRAGDGQGAAQTFVPDRPTPRTSNIPRRGRFS